MKGIRPIYYFILFLLLVLCQGNLLAQKWEPLINCSLDTLDVGGKLGAKYQPVQNLETSTFEILKCETRSDFGLSFQSAYGVNKFAKNNDFFDDYGQMNLQFGVHFRNWQLAYAVHIGTKVLNKDMLFEADSLKQGDKFNHLGQSILLGYSLNFNSLISVEPYMGISTNKFLTIGTAEGKVSKPIIGNVLGAKLYKYFNLKAHQHAYMGLFLNASYHNLALDQLNPMLENHYINFSVGLVVKGYFKKVFYQEFNLN